MLVDVPVIILADVRRWRDCERPLHGRLRPLPSHGRLTAFAAQRSFAHRPASDRFGSPEETLGK
jgi:hypothetical protein